ncbi:WAS/WASL-interacting protein family member 1 isoform X2 [Gadus morhua]|uniref:WAS/WASL-interacting protein family member 1 isoform X2 n=1 Tax=Gadus morhua TaxID=8049 RepID=UPI0011B4E7AB|nr:WAS/WASL-interacting protein family member 1-like isoform X2 [Gadus morhua]
MSTGDSHGSSLDDPPYSKVLMLGAIAAASAFVVTIFIVLVCVGCQRKGKSKHPPAGEKGTSVNLGTLRHPKLNSMSKSDTRLHEINRYGNGVPKNRPASMDLLLLHTQRSPSDLRPSPSRQLPQIPTSRSPSPRGGALRDEGDVEGGGGGGGGRGGGGGGGGEMRDHTYTEVGIRSNPAPSRCLDDGLYETVAVREGDADPKMPPAPPPTSANTPAAVRAAQSPPNHANGGRDGNGNGGRGNALNGAMRGRVNGVNGVNRSPLSSLNSLANQEPTAAEYATIRKFRKGDKVTRKENNAADSQSDSQSSVSDSPSAHPPPPPLHRSQELPRKPLEPFHLHSFPKEAVFIGNGEQYIWKPPEDDDIITLHAPPHLPETRKGQPPVPTAKEIADTYSTVCKPTKKKAPGDYNGAKTLPRSFRGDSGRGGNGCSRGRGVQAQARSHEDPCYQPSGMGGDRSWSACVAVATPVAPPSAAAADPQTDSAYGNIEPQRKREPPAASASASPTGGSATLKRKKPIPAPVPPPPQLPVPPPVPKKPASSASPAPPPRAAPGAPPGALPGGENFYESISEVKPGGSGGSGSSSGTTTIFTFNDGMEMYVTGL